jgi:hypothetical protein
MKNTIEAINELIKAVNIAQARGAYSIKEAHDAWAAIEFINNAVAQNQQAPQQPSPEQPL